MYVYKGAEILCVCVILCGLYSYVEKQEVKQNVNLQDYVRLKPSYVYVCP